MAFVFSACSRIPIPIWIVFLLLIGARASAQPDFRHCLHFNGAQRADAPVVLDDSTSDFTLEVRFKYLGNPNDAGMHRLVCWNTDSDYRLEMGVMNGYWAVVEHAVDGKSYFHEFDTTLLLDGDWHHAAYVRRADEASIWLDDSLLYQGPSDTRGGRRLMIGAWFNPGENWTGCIDELRVWRVARAPEELSEWRQKPLNASQLIGDRLLAYYPFDQGIAGAQNKHIGALEDAKGRFSALLRDFALTGDVENFVDWERAYDPPPPFEVRMEESEMVEDDPNPYEDDAEPAMTPSEDGPFLFSDDVVRDLFLNAPVNAGLDSVKAHFGRGWAAEIYTARPRAYTDGALPWRDTFVLSENNFYYQFPIEAGRSFIEFGGVTQAVDSTDVFYQLEIFTALTGNVPAEKAALIMIEALQNQGLVAQKYLYFSGKHMLFYDIIHREKRIYQIVIIYTDVQRQDSFVQVFLTVEQLGN